MGLISIDGYEPKWLSYSTINSYRSCGKRLYFEKILRLEQIPGLAAIGGNAVHVASQIVDEFILEHGFDALDSGDIIILDIHRNDNN